MYEYTFLQSDKLGYTKLEEMCKTGSLNCKISNVGIKRKTLLLNRKKEREEGRKEMSKLD